MAEVAVRTADTLRPPKRFPAGYLCDRDSRRRRYRPERKEHTLPVEATRPAAPRTSASLTLDPWVSINAIRVLAMDAVEQANSGHPGTPMALAPVAYLLWSRHLRHNPADPGWEDRDRFVLSCGHASMLLYGLLHLSGYDLPLDEIRNFRQWHSRTPGHPERGHTAGVEVTTGPLGQGIGNAVGMAMAERFLAARYNHPDATIVDHRTWALVSDGDLMEGVASEAASLAGHLKLGKLALIYDDNRITIDGNTGLSFTEDASRRFEGYGWRVLHVSDGNDLDAIDTALATARAETERPTLIVLRTVIADPAPTKRNTSEAHGAPLGADEVRRTKAILGWAEDQKFVVPEGAYADMGRIRTHGAEAQAGWAAAFERYRAAHPADAAEYAREQRGELPEGWDRDLPTFPADKGGVETRKASAAALQAILPRVGNLVGGSADLAGSTGVGQKLGGAFGPGIAGRAVHWGVREHAMGACMNGLAAHGGIRPFGSTFLVFFDYMKPSIRLAALMGLPVIYIGTHDSIGVGEDGPTHQPVDQLPMLRAIPNLVTLRPADANETVASWKVALERKEGPTAIVLTRQKVPVLPRLATAAEVSRGAYVVHEPASAPHAILLATGSEVGVAMGAAAELEAAGVPARVVSMPSWELFAAQPRAYRDQVLPPAVTARVAIEAASPFGWERWVGEHGSIIAMRSFGASAPADRLFTEFGFTPAAAAAAVRDLLTRSNA
jgi:transketolase